MSTITDEPIVLRYEYDIEGNKIPVYSAKAETTITNIKTGVKYSSEDHCQHDIDDPHTDTCAEDIRRDVKIIAPKLFTSAFLPKK